MLQIDDLRENILPVFTTELNFQRQTELVKVA